MPDRGKIGRLGVEARWEERRKRRNGGTVLITLCPAGLVMKAVTVYNRRTLFQQRQMRVERVVRIVQRVGIHMDGMIINERGGAFDYKISQI